MNLKSTILLTIFILNVESEIIPNTVVNTGPTIGVNKCCEEHEFYQETYCTDIRNTTEHTWKPIFTSEDGKTNIQVNYR